MKLTDTDRRALALIASNPRELLPAGNALVSAGVPALLRAGLIVHDPSRWVAFRVSALGETIKSWFQRREREQARLDRVANDAALRVGKLTKELAAAEAAFHEAHLAAKWHRECECGPDGTGIDCPTHGDGN